MGAFYRKYRKIFLALTIANVVVVILQIGFAYGHFLKHEWWGLALSVFFGSINAVCAVQQYRQWRRVIQEEKDYMWSTLLTPSEVLR